MTYEETLNHLDTAIKQDRTRFFRLADTLHLQPKYAEYFEALELLKQQWRDITILPGYPNIDFPLLLPTWFPKWQFMNIIKDETIKELTQDWEENISI